MCFTVSVGVCFLGYNSRDSSSSSTCGAVRPSYALPLPSESNPMPTITLANINKYTVYMCICCSADVSVCNNTYLQFPISKYILISLIQESWPLMSMKLLGVVILDPGHCGRCAGE